MFIPKIDPDKCNNCGECIDVCPTEVIVAEGGRALVVSPADCLGCESCIAACSEEAVRIEEI
jgi:NAD-dependent dihydropyrimidine dehydrogenase PreA subunit